jgi:DNA-binding NtrC family response regulator
VITDLVMPYISGVGVISIIKKKYPGIPVIAITGWGEHPGALATEAEADLVLDKPFELPDLDNHVKELLEKKQE